MIGKRSLSKRVGRIVLHLILLGWRGSIDLMQNWIKLRDFGASRLLMFHLYGLLVVG